MIVFLVAACLIFLYIIFTRVTARSTRGNAWRKFCMCCWNARRAHILIARRRRWRSHLLDIQKVYVLFQFKIPCRRIAYYSIWSGMCVCVCGKHTHTKRHDVIACSNKNNNHLRKYSNLQCCVRCARNGRKLLTNKDMVHVRMSFFRYARAGKSVCVCVVHV